MSKDNLPNLNLTAEEIAEALKDIKVEDLLPPKDKLPSKPYYKCEHCLAQFVARDIKRK